MGGEPAAGARANSLTLTVADAAGNTNWTNIAVFQSPVNITFTSIPAISNQTSITVQGTIDTTGYMVWVNGVQATSDQDGTDWTAWNVPLNGTGTAVIQARAIPVTPADNYGNGSGGGGGTNSTLQNPGNPDPTDYMDNETNLDYLPAIICTSYTILSEILWTDSWPRTNDTQAEEHWAMHSPGDSLSTAYVNYVIYNPYSGGWSPNGFSATCQFWDQFGYGSTVNYYSMTNNDFSNPTGTNSSTQDVSGMSFIPEESSYSNSTPGWNTSQFISGIENANSAVYTVHRYVASSFVLRTGGKAGSHRWGLFQLGVTAQYLTQRATPSPKSVAVPYNKITVMGQPLGNDNNFFVSAPDGIMVAVPVDVPGLPTFTFNVTPTKYQLVIQVTTNGATNSGTVTLNPDTPTTFCVGQNLQFQFTNIPVAPNAPPLSILPTSYAYWTLPCPDKYVNHSSQRWHARTGYVPGYGPIDLGEAAYVYYGSTNYTNLPGLNQGQLTNQCWYVNGCSNVLATVGGRLYFPNGTSVNCGASGRISIDSPQVTQNDTNLHGSPYFSIETGPTKVWLSVGSARENNNMAFNAHVDSQYPGKAAWTQLITGRFNNGGHIESIVGSKLDNSLWVFSLVMVAPPHYDGPIPFGDAPKAQCAGSYAAENLSFIDYLRFIPDGIDNIPVTLQIATWKANGSAELVHDKAWQVQAGSAVSGPDFQKSSALPEWSFGLLQF